MSKNDEIAEAFVRSCEAETGKQIGSYKVETLSGILSNASEYALPATRDTRPQRGGWAPGLYACICGTCKGSFTGDKIAVTCAPCAHTEPEAATEQREFTFDVLLFATMRVKSATEEEAREKLRMEIDGNDANFGVLDGEPVVCGVSFNGAPELIEVDGEAV